MSVEVKKDCWICEYLELLIEKDSSISMICGKTREMCEDVCDDFELWEYLKEVSG